MKGAVTKAWAMLLLAMLFACGEGKREPADRVNEAIAAEAHAAAEHIKCSGSEAAALAESAIRLELQGKNEQAVKEYVWAAHKGSSKAAARLAQIYETGIEGVLPDKTESLRWQNTARELDAKPKSSEGASVVARSAGSVPTQGCS